MDLSTAPALRQDPLELALQRELESGERVLWRGRRLARIERSGFGMYLFAIPWTAFALFWTAMAYAGVNEGFDGGDGGSGVLAYAFPLFGLPFILVGLGMLSIPFLPLLGAGNTMFAVTDRRLIRIYLGRRLKTESASLDRTGRIERSERRDGSGTIRIETGQSYDSDGDRRVEQFEIGEVENAILVEDTLRNAIERLKRREISS